MKSKTLLEAVQERIVLFDGGMGTMLLDKGLKKGDVPEKLNLTQPEIVRGIHQEYLQAGAEALLTNTFGGSSIKLGDSGLQEQARAINRAAVEIARSAGTAEHFVVGDIGPTGKILEPFGELTEADLQSSIEEQVRALLEGGVDAIIFETQMDVREALIGLKVAKGLTNLPLIVSFTFNKSKQGYFTLMGNSVKDAIRGAETAGADIIGSNCGLNSHEMKDLIIEINSITSKPIYAKANAGSPKVVNGNVTYAQTVDEYIKDIPEFLNNGVRLIGGCCGTNPEFITALKQIISGRR